MQGYYIKKVGEHRGSPRVWLEGSQTERAGFLPGQRYDIEVQGQMVVLQANKDGSRVVSGKFIGERSNPVIDINSRDLLAIFDGMAAIRVVVKKDQIYLLPLANELKKKERFNRLRDKLEAGEPLAIGSLSHGGGVLSHAVHTGLQNVGVKTRLAFANEIRDELLEHAAIHNDAWSPDTQLLATPMQELAFDDRGVASIPKVDILEAGLPCSGASKAGRSKRGLALPEAHPHVGHLVVSALVIVSKANPAFVILENVVPYAQSASADILRNQLRDMGYVTHERILKGKEWGSIENRDRWCLVAATAGIPFDFDQLQPPGASPQLIADVLDKTIGPDAKNWREFEYLKTKEVRDAEKGSGFGMQVVSPTDNSVGVIRKGYSKGGSTDVLLSHPDNPKLLRQFTAAEHARIKGVPPSIVAGLSETIAHQVLGQGVVYTPFESVGSHVGNAINEWMGLPRVETGQPSRSATPLQALPEPVDVAHSVIDPPPKLQQQLDFEDSPVSTGVYSGLVVSVDAGLVIQKVDRSGRTVQHDARVLSEKVQPGTVVDIKYSGGRGTVAGNGLSSGLDR